MAKKKDTQPIDNPVKVPEKPAPQPTPAAPREVVTDHRVKRFL